MQLEKEICRADLEGSYVPAYLLSVTICRFIEEIFYNSVLIIELPQCTGHNWFL
jgi:hypothetical protein